MSLKETLRRRLDGARRVAVLAVGSRLRADDEAGLLAADALETLLQNPQEASHGSGGATGGLSASAELPSPIPLSVFFGETTPENLTGEIRAFGPSHVVILDAADLGRRPGTVELVPVEAPTLATSASTHGLPLEVLANYLRQSIGCDVLVLGIQPASREYGRLPSKAVRLAARRAAAALVAALEPWAFMNNPSPLEGEGGRRPGEG